MIVEEYKRIVCNKCGELQDACFYYSRGKSKRGFTCYDKRCKKCLGVSMRTTPAAGMRYCSKCDTDHPEEDFYKGQGAVCKMQLLLKRKSSVQYRQYANAWLKKYQKKGIDEMSDQYLSLLSKQQVAAGGPIAGILVPKEAIEVKRAMLGFKRELKKWKEASPNG